MPSYVHEFIDGNDTIFHFLIEFEITSYGAPATWWDPAEGVEFEITKVTSLTHILLHEANAFRQLRSGRPDLWRESVGTGLLRSVNYYFYGEELTPHQYAFFQLIMKKEWDTIIDENWDTSWVDDYDDCDDYRDGWRDD